MRIEDCACLPSGRWPGRQGIRIRRRTAQTPEADPSSVFALWAAPRQAATASTRQADEDDWTPNGATAWRPTTRTTRRRTRTIERRRRTPTRGRAIETARDLISRHYRPSPPPTSFAFIRVYSRSVHHHRQFKCNRPAKRANPYCVLIGFFLYRDKRQLMVVVAWGG